MDRPGKAAIRMLGRSVPIGVAMLLAGCATAVPDTPKQAKTRADLEACRAQTGGTAHDLQVDQEGRYSWKSPTASDSLNMTSCMREKGYNPLRR